MPDALDLLDLRSHKAAMLKPSMRMMTSALRCRTLLSRGFAISREEQSGFSAIKNAMSFSSIKGITAATALR